MTPRALRAHFMPRRTAEERRPTSPPTWIGPAGVVLALAAGIAAGAGRGFPVVAALAVLGIGIASVAIYLRDPTRALILLWLVVVLNAPVSVFVGYGTPAGRHIQQADEFFVLLFMGLTVLYAVHTNARVPLPLALPAVCIAAFGLLSAAFHDVPLSVASVALWLGLKLWLMIIAALVLPWKPNDLARVYRTLSAVGIAVAVLGILELVTHGAVLTALHLDVPVTAGTRDAASIRSIFFHPNEFSLFMSMFFALTLSRFACAPTWRGLVLVFLFACAALLSLRLKGFLSLGVATSVVLAAQFFAHRTVRMLHPVALTLVGLAIIVGAYSLESGVINGRLSVFTASEPTPRSRLYDAGAAIATDNFPLGVGFGRFASYPSQTDYSPVYAQYGLSTVYGLSQAFPDFLGDVSWPTVMGETGFAGLASYLLGLIILVRIVVLRLRRATPEMRWAPLAALAILAVILTDSLGSPALFNWIPAITFALIFGPVVKYT